MGPNDSGGYARLITKNYGDRSFLSGARQDNKSLMGQWPDIEISFVEGHATAGSKLAVTDLMERGVQRIGIITSAPLIYISTQQRRNGYPRALKKVKQAVSRPPEALTSGICIS